ncbi:hypothetical protein DM860_005518 [Cuscuta australis]|uniref:SHSP domain-containing protein n=1 Tax=Cuscuta australis TaxID=267555 RepID=A0A328DZL2_9ASTE|nr:hypothetical protein DM860_005518 [Cuscuta australis]
MWPREGGGYYIKDETEPFAHQERQFGMHKIYLTFLSGLPGVYKREKIKMEIDKEKGRVSVVGEGKGEYKDVWLRFERVLEIPKDCVDMDRIYLDDTYFSRIIRHPHH